MATIDDKKLIDQLIAGNGRIDRDDGPDNPWAMKVIEYTNAHGNQTWGVVFEGERSHHGRYEIPTEYVRNPKVIWRRERETPGRRHISDELAHARVHCPTHGPVNLSHAEYSAQMNDPDSLWICPFCSKHARFDDVFYEEKNP